MQNLVSNNIKKQVAEYKNLKVATRSSVPEEEKQFRISPLFVFFY